MKTTAKHSKLYVKPAVLSTSSAKSTIQRLEATKMGHSYDGTQATSPAYAADE
jgi:hypothetical protein